MAATTSFQSHNGAIAARQSQAKSQSAKMFQSHNGAIAACRVNIDDDSSVVKVSIPQWCDCCARRSFSRLTFSVVSIPQWCDCCRQIADAVKRRDADGFNPTMVRLLQLPLRRKFSKPLVSIPQWCDCCTIMRRWLPNLFLVSIPQWCDCCPFRVFLLEEGVFGFNPTMVRLLQIALG